MLSNATNKLKLTAELGYNCPRGLSDTHQVTKFYNEMCWWNTDSKGAKTTFWSTQPYDVSDVRAITVPSFVTAPPT